MDDYDFTVLIDRVPTDLEADLLYEAGLDDGNIVSGNGQARIMVTRRAHSLGEAILSTVSDIQAAGFAATGLVNDDLVNMAEIARRVGRSHESIRLHARADRGPGGFPAPVATGLYSWSQVRNWLSANGVASLVVGDREDETVVAADLLLRARQLCPDIAVLKDLVDQDLVDRRPVTVRVGDRHSGNKRKEAPTKVQNAKKRHKKKSLVKVVSGRDGAGRYVARKVKPRKTARLVGV